MGKQMVFPEVPTLPDGADGMNHPFCRQPEPRRNPRLAGRAPAKRATIFKELRPCRTMNGAVHAAPSQQAGIGGIDDGVHPLQRNVALYDPYAVCRVLGHAGPSIPYSPQLIHNRTMMQTARAPLPASVANILVVDDDQRLRDLLNRYLAEQGFGVHAVANGSAMERVMGKENVDMIILDLMLPGEDGMSICRRLRAAGKRTPIIMLTAKGDEADRIAGLDVGADDYLPKPFNPRELVASINAVLRRQSPASALPGAPDDSKAPVDSAHSRSISPLARSPAMASSVGLTTGEFAMLKALVTHPRTPLSRDRLMELARGTRIRRIRPQHRRTGLAPAPAAGGRSRQSTIHPDRMGRGLRLRSGRRPANSGPAAMSWVPQSLLSRSVLLISALLVVSQLIWFGLYRSYNMRTQSEYLANQIASVISTVSVALETMPSCGSPQVQRKTTGAPEHPAVAGHRLGR